MSKVGAGVLGETADQVYLQGNQNNASSSLNAAKKPNDQIEQSRDDDYQDDSSDANYRVEIDSQEIRDKIEKEAKEKAAGSSITGDNAHLAMDEEYIGSENQDSDDFNDERESESDHEQPSQQSDLKEGEKPLSVQTPIIMECLYTLRRVCQIDKLNFD